jgi:hypothetical protein
MEEEAKNELRHDRDLALGPDTMLGDWAEEAIDYVSQVQPLNFLAQVLPISGIDKLEEDTGELPGVNSGEEERRCRTVIASPIYVAFADRSDTD